MARLIDRIRNKIRYTLFPGRAGAALFFACHPFKRRFRCPLCGYHGPFRDVVPPNGHTLHSNCPRCGSNERGRLQFFVFEKLRERLPLDRMTLTHFSPERFLQPYLRRIFGTYHTAGICQDPVDIPADLTALPFADGSCDCIFASHVLEHIKDDDAALREIRRVLRPGGMAILPVPIVQLRTVEYDAPNERESGHVRAPGLDYFDRYRRHFATVEVWDSKQFPSDCQLLVYEDRTGYPNPESPSRLPMPGYPHPDYVPVCVA
jgi:SAM-dependent methyltransferase